MKRKERTKILVHCEKEFLQAWADRFDKEAPYQVLEKPSQSLTMVKMRESAQKSLFYLCEVLISEARVECNGVIGIGMIQGIEEEKAYALAVIDAAFRAQLPGVKELEEELIKKAKQQEEEMRIRREGIEKTKVNFETMDV